MFVSREGCGGGGGGGGGGAHLRLGQIYFPLADMFYVWGQIRLAILHSGKYVNLSLKASSVKT
jgi:hypothetical protein